MSMITVNTIALKHYVNDLSSKKNYYSAKKNTFLSNNYNASTCSKLNNFLLKIITNYDSISENIQSIAKSMEEYYKNIEAIENRMSEKNGYITIATVSSLANRYSGTIKRYRVEDENIFNIQLYNSNINSSSSKVDLEEENSIEVTETKKGFFSKIAEWFNGLTKMKSRDLPINDSSYQISLNQYSTQCNETISLYQQYLDAAMSEREKYSEIESDLAAIQLYYVEEVREFYKKGILNRIKKEGFESIKEFQQYLNELDAYIEECNFAIQQVQNIQTNAKYEFLLYTEDYQSFTYNDEVYVDKIELYGLCSDGELQFDICYEKYIKENGYVNPLEFYITLTNEYENLRVSVSRKYTKQEDQFKSIADAAKIDSEMAKMYIYIYENFGIEYADEYLYNYESIANQLVGMKEAEEILAKLETTDDIENALKNHLKISGQGLGDGIETFAEGIKNAFSIIPSLFGTVPSQSYSVNEYASMYLLSALQSEDSPYAGAFLSNNYEISEGIGNMLPSIALSYFCPVAGSVALGVSSGGNSYHSSLVEGYSNIEALTYGIISGASEAITEKMLGGIPGIGSDIKVNSLKTLFQSMLKEGGEEAFQEVFDTYVRAGVFGEKVDYNELYENMKKSAIYGGITAGILQTPGAIYNNINTTTVKNAYQNGDITEIDIRNTLKLAGIDPKNMTIDQMIQKHFDILIEGLNSKINVKPGTEQVNPTSESTIEQWNTPEPLKPVSAQIEEANDLSIKELENVIDNELNKNSTGIDSTEKIMDITEKIIDIDIEPTEKIMDITEKIIDDGMEPTEKIIDNLQGLNDVDSNIKDLKEEILKEVDLDLDEFSKIRKLYIELNKRLHYDPNYVKGDELQKQQIYTKEATFENLINTNIICKSWSELFKELLIASGIDESRIQIMGGTNIGNHKWIEITMQNGIIIADATETIQGKSDLSNCKTNANTIGLFYGEKSYTGRRLLQLPKETLIDASNAWLSIDKSIGYVNGEHYSNEIIALANKTFQNSKIYKKLFTDQWFQKNAQQLFNTEISSVMNGHEAYLYLKNMKQIIFDDMIKIEPPNRLDLGWGVRPIENGFEWVTTMQCINNEQNLYMIYSETLGKLIFTNLQEYLDVCKKYNISR